jgi:hypothetical protein
MGTEYGADMFVGFIIVIDYFEDRFSLGRDKGWYFEGKTYEEGLDGVPPDDLLFALERRLGCRISRCMNMPDGECAAVTFEVSSIKHMPDGLSLGKLDLGPSISLKELQKPNTVLKAKHLALGLRKLKLKPGMLRVALRGSIS